MRRVNVVVCLVLASLAGVMTSGCGSSSAVSGPDGPDVQPVAGSSVLHGALLAPGISSASAAPGLNAQSGGEGWVVSVAGTSQSSEVDQDGRFVLAGVPSGSVTVKVEGPGVSAQVAVSGLVDGQVTSVEIRMTGAGAQLASDPTCTPTAETYFSGKLDQVVGTQLVVSGRRVDASQLRKVWRGERRIQLSELSVGEKVKVWGVLRGDAVVLAEEIAALTTGSDGRKAWTTFSGKVDLVEGKGFLPNPTPTKPTYQVLYVAGRKVKTDAGTKFRWSDGTALDAAQIRAGDQAYVEGWGLPEGYVEATKLVIDCR
jgi:hypothetical protein